MLKDDYNMNNYSEVNNFDTSINILHYFFKQRHHSFIHSFIHPFIHLLQLR